MVPTIRCKRCGAWLSSLNQDGEYCHPCLDTMARKQRPCGECGEPFFHDDAAVIRCESCQEEYLSVKRTCAVCGADFVPFTCKVCSGRKQESGHCHACHWREAHAEAAAARERTCKVCGCSFLPRTCVVAGCGARLADICTVCHEQVAHDGLRVTVWRLEDCPRCENAIVALEGAGRKVITRDLQRLVRGDEPDVDAMAHLAMIGGQAPLVRVDGRFLEPHEIEDLVATGSAFGETA